MMWARVCRGPTRASPRLRCRNINSILIRTGYGYFGPPTGRSADAAKFDRPPNHLAPCELMHAMLAVTTLAQPY
jgi:hypothetical protein